ncbi:MAG TPA: YdcF family protein [Chryseosolibacter sp.]
MARKFIRKFLKIFLYTHLFLLVGLLCTHCTFTHYANKSYAEAKKAKPYDVVIVPGVPFEGENTTGVMKMRLFWAKHLYDSGYTRNIIFSGSSVYSPYVEGIVMKTMADSLGIPPEHTFSETKAEHSTENAYYGYRMAKQLGFSKIALATDPFQSGMLRSFMRRFCPGMRSVPIIFGTLNIDDKQLPKIDSTAGYVPAFVSITERESFWQRMRGTLGKKVKEEAKADMEREAALKKQQEAGAK